MFEAVRNNKRFAQIILAILIIPFAFFGMDAYFSDGPGSTEVATVGGSRISAFEFDEALRDQQDRLRQSMGNQVDRALLDSPELRRAVLDNLINQRVLALHAAENRFVVTQAQLQEAIAEVPAFQDNGQFSMQRYEALLSAQGMTPSSFEARLSQDIRIQQIALAVGDAAFAASESPRRFLAAQLEERQVRELRFSAADYLPKVQLAEDAAQRFYEANPDRFARPARVKAEYLVFDENALLGQVSVTGARPPSCATWPPRPARTWGSWCGPRPRPWWPRSRTSRTASRRWRASARPIRVRPPAVAISVSSAVA